MRFLYVVVGLFFLGSCSVNEVVHEDKKPRIVVTTSLLADLIKNIVKDSATVYSLMGPGVDPHLYKASLGDLKQLIHADLVFYQGLHLEGKLGEVLEKLARTKAVIGVGNDLPLQLIRRSADKGNTPDPHIWFDVSIWKQLLQLTCDKLIQEMPASATYFETNTTQYTEQLDSLDSLIREEISSIPMKKRVLITSHDAFNYFGEAYSMEVKGLQGISTLAEFGLRDVSNLVNFIVEREIGAVFVEKSISSRALEAVVAGVREKGSDVVIGGSLYTDALGDATSPEGTYIGMMEYNAKTIVNGLK